MNMKNRIRTATVLGAAILLASLTVMPNSGARAEEATCRDLYDRLYQTCFNGGVEVGVEGCGQLVDMLGPALMGEEGVSGFSAALSVAICKKACEDGAKEGERMSFSVFKREFCGRRID